MRTPLEIGHVLRVISSKMKTNNKIASDFTNVIKLRYKPKNQEQEQVIEKIARSFFCAKKKKELDKQVEVCGEAP